MRIELEYDKMEHALKRVLLEFGVSILNEPVRFMAVWKDFGAGLVDEGELIQRFLKLNLVPSLLEANYGDMDSRVRWCKWASEYMASNGIDQNEAKRLAQIWARALCWESPKPSAQNKQENIVKPQVAPANVVTPGVVQGVQSGVSQNTTPQNNVQSGNTWQKNVSTEQPAKLPNKLSMCLRSASRIIKAGIVVMFVACIFEGELSSLYDFVEVGACLLGCYLIPYAMDKAADKVEINNAKKHLNK